MSAGSRARVVNYVQIALTVEEASPLLAGKNIHPSTHAFHRRVERELSKLQEGIGKSQQIISCYLQPRRLFGAVISQCWSSSADTQLVSAAADIEVKRCQSAWVYSQPDVAIFMLRGEQKHPNMCCPPAKWRSFIFS
ncbi:hypothetical protein XENOCAPTIV_023068 [Xenoophorus captivus]|uniref:Uncharacterized protein n=1 Tax=Xenoophorus captivus TaxID=1517983 RepID=A0ABV0RBF8_9TELE